jgi:pilus assembly protein CpaE
MSAARVAAVGGPKTFQPEVARALGSDPEGVAWLPSIASAEKAIADLGEPYDVMVLAATVRDDDAVGFAELVAKESPTTAVLLVRDVPVDGAFPRLVRSGVRDVVDLTRGKGELKEALNRAVQWTSGVRGIARSDEGPDEHRGVIVSVFSTKGGAGKTFFSCNLAAALAERSGSSVALLDLDHDLGDVFAYFGADPQRPLRELLALEDGADPETVAGLGTTLIDGVVGFGSPPDPRAEPLPAAAIMKMLRTLKESFPYTVVDASSDYSDHVLASFDLSDAICLISGLDAIGVRHLSIALRTMESIGVSKDRLRVVMNRADSKVDLTPDDVERLLAIRVDGKIPSSALVARSINHGKLLWVEERRSDVAKGIEAFADRLIGQLTPKLAESSAGKQRRWKKG